MEKIIIIVFPILTGLLCMFIILNFVFRLVSHKLEKYIQDNFDKKDLLGVTTRANFFGFNSLGGKQIRGNGALVLTEDKLHFFRGSPFKEFVFPINSIKNITLPKSFNGKSVFAQLLCLEYEIDGKIDSVAWALREPQRWKDGIENLIN